MQKMPPHAALSEGARFVTRPSPLSLYALGLFVRASVVAGVLLAGSMVGRVIYAGVFHG